MKKCAYRLSYLPVISVLLLFFSSCISVKDLKYFQDISDSTKLANIKLSKYSTPVLHKGDIISVLFYTTDPAMALGLNSPVASSVGASSSNQVDQSGYLIDDNGEVEIPQIGKVYVENLTTDQAHDAIQKKSLDILVNPVVIVKTKGIKVQVLGEVNKAGFQYLPVGKTTIIDAISFAGDFTAFGRKDNILLLRTNLDNTISTIRISLKTSEILSSKYYYLMNNDVLIVEPTKAKAIASDAAFTRNISLLTIGLSVLTTLLVIFRR